MHDAETFKSGLRVSLLVFIVPGMGMTEIVAGHSSWPQVTTRSLSSAQIIEILRMPSSGLVGE
jgi:hypothetical protein